MPFNLVRQREVTRLTCLVAFAGRDSIQSVVFDATTISPSVSGTATLDQVTGILNATPPRYYVPIGTFLTWSTNDPTKVMPYTGGGADANAVQTVTCTDTPTGGTFKLSFGGATTAPIAYNATGAEVASAVGALPNVGPTNVAGSGGPLPGTPVLLTFQGLLAHQPVPTGTLADNSLTGGSSPTITVVTTTPGTYAQHIIGVFDGPDRDFFGNTVGDDEPIPMYFHACVFNTKYLQNWDLYGAQAKTDLSNCDFLRDPSTVTLL